MKDKSELKILIQYYMNRHGYSKEEAMTAIELDLWEIKNGKR